MTEEKVISVRVFRFEPGVDEKPRYETYRVPVAPGAMVLDALNTIRQSHDPTLRYRHSCHMGKCGSCAVSIDGRPGLACWELVYDGMVIEPLPGLRTIADLVVDREETELEKEGLLFERKSSSSHGPDETERLDIPHRAGLDEVRTCIHCFSCVSACPYIHAEEKTFIGPKRMVEMARYAYDPRLDQARSLRVAFHHGIWDCLACLACTKVCPQGIDPRERIVDMRAMLMDTPELKGVPVGARDLNHHLFTRGNPYGFPKTQRGLWAHGLEIKDLTQGQEAEYVYFAGCAQGHEIRDQEVARGLVSLFRMAGVDFGTLGPNEGCCGDPARFTGESGLYERIREQNIHLFKEARFQKIVTTCPHGFFLFRNEYGLGDVQVKHYSQLLAELIRDGALKFTRRRDQKVTYHDSCYLGRYSRIFDDPRFVLQAIPGLELVEMKNQREQSLCCGGGGAGAFLDIQTEPRISWVRAKQARETGAETIAVACPLCRTMLEDAVKTLDLDLKVRHVSELVLEALQTEYSS